MHAASNTKGMLQVAHILFVDSPVGAGFSFSTKPEGYQVGDVSSSLQIHDFLIKWFSDHPKYHQNSFYIGGDSYAGKLIPFIAHIISQGTILMRLIIFISLSSIGTLYIHVR
jgi:carboxypeptidase C (cathepsin A)